MAFLSTLKIFLLIFGVFPHRNINCNGFVNTSRIVFIVSFFFFVGIPAGAKCYWGGNGQDTNSIIVNLQTMVNFSAFGISYLALVRKRTELHKLMCDMQHVVEERETKTQSAAACVA